MHYKKITTERQFKDATGHDKASFLKLADDFKATYYELNGVTYEEHIKLNVMEEPKFKTLEEALFFVLFQMKNDLIFGSLGVVFGMSSSTAHDNFKCFSMLLSETLEKKSYAKTKI